MSQSASLSSSSLFVRKGEAAPSAGGGLGFSTPHLAWDGEDAPEALRRAPVIEIRLPPIHRSHGPRPRLVTPPFLPQQPESQDAAAAPRRPPPRPPAKADDQGRVRVAARLPEGLYRLIRSQAIAEGCAMADLLGAAVVAHLKGQGSS